MSRLDPSPHARQPGQVILRSDLLGARTGVVHGFSTRRAPNGDPLDMGPGGGPGRWTALADAVGISGVPVAFASQVHGAETIRVTRGGLAGEADALITDRSQLLLAVRVADCVPVVLAGNGVVAAIHAGWRGLAAGVIPATLEALAGTGPWIAAVGPCICMDCYEVGEEVVDGIGAHMPESVFVRRGGKRPHVDPGAAAVWQLKQSGVESVERVLACTRCSSELWSHRRDGASAGRQVGVVGMSC